MDNGHLNLHFQVDHDSLAYLPARFLDGLRPSQPVAKLPVPIPDDARSSEGRANGPGSGRSVTRRIARAGRAGEPSADLDPSDDSLRAESLIHETAGWAVGWGRGLRIEGVPLPMMNFYHTRVFVRDRARTSIAS